MGSTKSGKARKKPTQERSKATVDAILTATAHILVDEGYADLSTNRVARRAGVSIGSLYQYFPNKQALVAALIERETLRDFAELTGQALEWMALPLEQVIRRFLAAVIELQRRNPQLHRVLLEQIPLLGDDDHRLTFEKRSIELLSAFLQSRRAEVVPGDIPAAAFVVYHAGSAVMHTALRDSSWVPSETTLIAESAALLVRYLTGAGKPVDLESDPGS